jgi:catechol 2,3-dioxygenase-like lactoylglutathione lyase family enzyme
VIFTSFLNKKLCPRFSLIRAEIVRYWDYAWYGTDKRGIAIESIRSLCVIYFKVKHTEKEGVMLMKVFGIRLLVRDYAASAHFWRDLMGFTAKFDDASIGYGYFELGAFALELFVRDGFYAALGLEVPSAVKQHQTVIDIQVDDVDATYAELVAQGVPSIAAPVDRPDWRARTAHVSDPDGYILELYTALQS